MLPCCLGCSGGGGLRLRGENKTDQNGTQLECPDKSAESDWSNRSNKVTSRKMEMFKSSFTFKYSTKLKCKN